MLTDGVFSMEGDLAPLPPLAALATEHDAWLMTDDAHGLGVVGDGRGSTFAWGDERMAVPLQMGTLSKAVGSYKGAYVSPRPNRPQVTIQRPYFDVTTSKVVDRTMILMSR